MVGCHDRKPAVILCVGWTGGIMDQGTLPRDFQLSPDRTAGLVRLIQCLSSARSLEAVLAAMRSGLRGVVAADGIAVILRDGDFCFYAEEDALGAPLAWKGARLLSTDCISGWCMRHRSDVVIDDVDDDQRLRPSLEAYRASSIKSMAMVPVHEDDPVAAVGAYWRHHHQADTTELAILRSAASAAALALSNSALLASLEEAVRHAETRAAEAARANLAKSRFLAAASHDLRQPLQALNLLTAVLRQSAPLPQAGVLDMMDMALTGMGELLNGLLDLSKLEAGIITPQPSPIDLGAMITAAAERHRPLADAKNLIIRVVPSRLTGLSDPVLMASILNNLIGNAVRFTERGGVLIGCRRSGNSVRLQVSDTGIGIPPDHQAHVFEEFYQVGNAARDRTQGLGLGLSIVARTARLLDHKLELLSSPGRGSTFSVILPLA